MQTRENGLRLRSHWALISILTQIVLTPWLTQAYMTSEEPKAKYHVSYNSAPGRLTPLQESRSLQGPGARIISEGADLQRGIRSSVENMGHHKFSSAAPYKGLHIFHGGGRRQQRSRGSSAASQLAKTMKCQSVGLCRPLL